MEKSTRTKIGNTTNKDNNSNDEDSQNSDKYDARYWQNSQQLLSLFPQLVWDNICSYLDSEEFLILINSSLLFRELFYDKRVNLLCKLVLDTLLPGIHRDDYLKNYFHEINRVDQVRNVRSVILNCREVCKSWKRAIDKIACTVEPSTSSYGIHEILSNCFEFIHSRKLDKFLQHFASTHPSHANPFPAKYIQLGLGHYIPGLQFCNCSSTLLEKYGQHIWTCIICLYPEFMNSPQLYHYIMAWINCMPNLRSLTIHYRHSFRVNTLPPTQLRILPLKLNYLKSLAITSDLRGQSSDRIFARSWMESCNFSELMVQENLEVLRLTILSNKDAEFFENITSPLKQLQVEYLCKGKDNRLCQVFTMLSRKFSNTLENLSISFVQRRKLSTDIENMQDSFNGRLNLPKVNKVVIRIDSDYCLDFLLGMQENLEMLIICCEGGKFGDLKYSSVSLNLKARIKLIESNQIIKFFGYEEKMLESNIWEMFPKLKRLSLQVSCQCLEWERTDWLKFQKLNSAENKCLP